MQFNAAGIYQCLKHAMQWTWWPKKAWNMQAEKESKSVGLEKKDAMNWARWRVGVREIAAGVNPAAPIYGVKPGSKLDWLMMIYMWKLNDMKPSLKVFVAKVKIVPDTEWQIAITIIRWLNIIKMGKIVNLRFYLNSRSCFLIALSEKAL